MQQLTIPPGVEWEVLVINNHSTDDTEVIADRHKTRLPLRHLLETKRGKSNAANLAVLEAAGDLLVWTDDDVIVSRDWLAEYVAAAQTFSEASFFGGSVEPWFAVEPPNWIRRHQRTIQGAYAVREVECEPRLMAPGEFPVGANFAARTEILRRYPYSTELGWVNGVRVGGEDSDVIRRMTEDGYRGMWIGKAMVRHYIPAERLSAKYLRSLYEGNGRCSVRLSGVPAGRRLFGVPRWVWKKYVTSELLYWLLMPTRNERWLRALMDSSLTRGVIKESRLVHRTAQNTKQS